MRPYDLWLAQGYLETTPGASISYEFIAERLKDIFDDHHVTKVAFDRWNYARVKPWLSKAGFFRALLLEQTFVEFGQGTKSMSPARALRKPHPRSQASAWRPSRYEHVQRQCRDGRPG